MKWFLVDFVSTVFYINKIILIKMALCDMYIVRLLHVIR